MTGEHIKELLPIGSIVTLNGAQKKLMIYGIYQTNSDTKKDYDYIGVLYPEGNIGAQMQFMFNHSDISEVFFRGYESAEHASLIEKLADYFSKEEQQ